MVTQIFVEGFELDLTDDIACELSYVIDDVKDFGSKNTSYSKTIVIQGTQRNNKVFNHISELGRFLAIENVNVSAANVNENYTAAIGSNCVILVDNIQIFKGKLRVLEVVRYANHVEYECAVFGELGGFYYELSKGIVDPISNINSGTKLLDQLDFTDLDHAWNYTKMTDSWSNRNTNPGVGYFYPLIDYGKVAESATRNHYYDQALRPAIYVKEYIDRIFSSVGYTYDCSFFESDFFKTLIVPNNDDRLKVLITQLLNISTLQPPPFNLTAASPYTLLWYAGTFRDFSSIGSGQYQYTGAATVSNTEFSFFMNMSIEGQGFYAVKLYKNGLEVAILDSFQTSNQGTTTNPYIYAKGLSTKLTIATNDIFKVVIEYLPYVGGLVSTIRSYSTTWQINTPVKVATQATIGDNLQMNFCVPKNIKITDFFTSILKLFNLYVVEDKFIPKRLIITPYIDFYTNEALDWTNKLDRSQEIRLKPMGELNARVFNFKFKNDDAYWNKTYKEKYNEGYMDFTYDSEYEYAKDKEDLEVIFASTINYAPNGQDKIVPALYKEGNFADESITSSNIRILQTKMLTVAHWDIKYTNGGNYQTNIHQFPYAGMWEHPTVPDNGTYFQSLGWASPKEIYYTITGTSVNYGLFNAFWSPYFAEITDPNSIILTAHFWLTMMDIRTLDFSKNILIDGTIWRINKIDNYNPLLSVPTKVELLKVIDNTFDYNQYVAGYKDRLNLAGAFYEGEACLVNKINNLELI
jgi:hypothetical protein